MTKELLKVTKEPLELLTVTKQLFELFTVTKDRRALVVTIALSSGKRAKFIF